MKSGSVKLWLVLLAGVFGIFFAVRLLSWVLGILTPILVVGGALAIVYVMVNRKALGGGRRTLP